MAALKIASYETTDLPYWSGHYAALGAIVPQGLSARGNLALPWDVRLPSRASQLARRPLSLGMDALLLLPVALPARVRFCPCSANGAAVV